MRENRGYKEETRQNQKTIDTEYILTSSDS